VQVLLAQPALLVQLGLVLVVQQEQLELLVQLALQSHKEVQAEQLAQQD
jgi:hypothetical protein